MAPDGRNQNCSVLPSDRKISAIGAGSDGRTESATFFPGLPCGTSPFSDIYLNVNMTNNPATVYQPEQVHSYWSEVAFFLSIAAVCNAVTHPRTQQFWQTNLLSIELTRARS
jgi:hypothetical protein